MRYREHRSKVRIERQKSKKKKIRGYLYFFKTTTNFYKVGCTTNWERRKKTYVGPAEIERLIFVRPVPNMFYAETLLKIFLEGHGYKPWRGRHSDWFLREAEDTSSST